MRKAVSAIELSFHVSVTEGGPCGLFTAVSPVGAFGGYTNDTGRIMSISSWLRMWQW